MKYISGKNGFDDLLFPIIICNSDGLVIYKNDAAVKNIRLPRRRTDILSHLNIIDRNHLRLLKYQSFPIALKVFTGDKNAYALVQKYDYNSVHSTLWIFPPFLQVNYSSVELSKFNNIILSQSNFICDIVSNMENKSKILDATEIKKLDSRICRKINRIISSIARDSENDCYISIDIFLNKCLSKVASVFNENKYCLDLLISESVCDSKDKISINKFIVFYTHVFSMLCEISQNNQVKADFKEIAENELRLSLSFSLNYPPFYTEKEDNLNLLEKFIHGHNVDIAVIKKFIDICGYKFRFSIKSDSYYNVIFDFSIPCISDDVHPNQGCSDKHCISIGKDLCALTNTMLLCANFIPDADRLL